MRQIWRDVCLAGILLVLPLLLFASVTLGNKTLVPADVLYTFEPYRSASLAHPVQSPQNPLLADLILENYPWKLFLVGAVQARRLPLWDPYLFAGHPFLANGQHSVLYPLTWIFFLMPIPRAFGVFITLQLGIAGISMYILMRVLGARYHGALLSGIIFQFSGFLVMSAVHPMIVAAASWLPLILACVDLTVRRARFFNQRHATLPWAMLGAMALGVQTLAGHAEMTYFVLLVTAAFAGWRIVYVAWRQPPRTWFVEIGTVVLGLLAMVVLGLALGAVQLLPLYEVASSSFRQGAVSLTDVLSWAYPKRRIITFLMPNFFGNPVHTTTRDVFSGQMVQATLNAYGEPVTSFDWGIKNYVEGAAYLGILSLFLAVIAVLHPPHSEMCTHKPRFFSRYLSHPYVPFFATLSFFALACIFGTPVYALVYALPFLNQSHSPFRWVFPLTLAVSALAGLGATTVAEFRTTHGPDAGPRTTSSPPQSSPSIKAILLRIFLFDTSLNLVSMLAALALWSGLLTLAGLWCSRILFDVFAPWVGRAFWALARASHVFPDLRTFYSYLFPWVQASALFLIVTGIVLRVSRCPIYLHCKLRKIPVWELLAVAVLLVDLVTFGRGFNPAVDPALLDYTPPVVTFLRQDATLWRFSTFDPHGRGTFTANSGMLYDFQDVRGYDSLFSAQYARYMGWIEPQDQLLYNRIAPFTQFSSLDSPLTDLLNVKYILTEEEIPLPKYKQVYEDNAIRVYENLGVMPRAFTLPADATLVVPDVQAVGKAVLKYDPRFYAMLEAEQVSAFQLPASDAAPGVLHPQSVIAYTPNEVLVDVMIETPGWLILTDAYFPGWKAFVRPPGGGEDQETEVPILRVAGNFRGIWVDQSAIVRFKYSPDSVKIGAFVSFLAGMTMVFFAAVWLWRQAYRETGRESAMQRVAKNSFAPILLTLFNRVVDLALAMLTLRILGPTNAGDYYYAGNVFLWFDIVANFGLNTYLTREIARHRDQARRYFINTTLIRVSLSLLAVPLLLGFIGLRQTLVASVTQPATPQAIRALLLLYVGLLPYSISTGLTALFYAYEKAEYPAVITTVTTLLRATLGTLVLVAGWGILGLAGASIVINVLTLVILSMLALRLFPAVWRSPSHYQAFAAPERGQRREMLRESWPLMVNHLLATLFFKVDVSLMEAILGNAALGRYSIGYKLLETLNIVPSMFTLALFPVLSQKAEDGSGSFLRFYRLGVKILVLLSFPAAIVTTLLAREMVLVLAGPEYLPGAQIALQFMAWSMPIGWINSLTQYVLIALDQQRQLIRAYLIGFGVSLGANLLLMPWFGYRASAVIHIFAELALLVPFTVFLRRQLGTVGWRSLLGKPMFAALSMAAVGLAFAPVNRFVALMAAIIVYPLIIWRLNVLTTDEQAMLAPLLKRR